MRAKLWIGAVLLFAAGFLVGGAFCIPFARWMVAETGAELIVTGPLDGLLFGERCAFYTAILFAAGPLAALILGPVHRWAAWAVGFALLAVSVSAVLIPLRRYEYNAHSKSIATIFPEVSASSFQVSEIPLGEMLLTGPIIVIVAAALLRVMHCRRHRPPPLPGRD